MILMIFFDEIHFLIIAFLIDEMIKRIGKANPFFIINLENNAFFLLLV
jgi:Na+/melibiose symporter-like transporter